MLDTTAEIHTPKVGDYLVPDRWGWIGNKLTESDGFKDSSFPGCQFRISATANPEYSLAINLTVTGKPHYGDIYEQRKIRVKIEWVGDGEPSTFSGGWLHYNI